MTTLPTSDAKRMEEFSNNISNKFSPYESSVSLSSSGSAPPPLPPPHRHIPLNNSPSPSLMSPPITNNGPEDVQYFQQNYPQHAPKQAYYSIGETAEDGNYLPDSSLQMAILAGKKRYDRLNAPTDPEFPPVTVENINKLRQEAKSSQDPRLQFFFARFLLDAVKHLKSNTQDPIRVKQLKDNLTNEAIKTIKKLTTHKIGYADAQFFLANCYGGGLHDLKPDSEKAFSLYLQGSKQNHPESCYRVAVCYELGMGTKKDYRYAIQLYRKAANLTDPSGMYKLGLILLNGLIGQSKNPREAISWFLRAAQNADHDHPQPLHELALAYEQEENPILSVIPDVNYSRELYSQAAQLGYAPSQFKLGLAYENGHLNCPMDPRRSIAWYSRAAEQNDPNAEIALSGWYLTGAENVLIQNDKEAYLWARKAADRGLAKAEYAVGYYNETGVGVVHNIEEAKQWYTRASNHGDPKAAQRLQALAQTQVTVKRRPTRDKNSDSNAKDSDCRIM